MGSTHFLMKRLNNVRTGMALRVFDYNLKRVISILGIGPLMAANPGLKQAFIQTFDPQAADIRENPPSGRSSPRKSGKPISRFNDRRQHKFNDDEPAF